MLERPVLPVAPRRLQPEERDRDLPLERAGRTVAEEAPVADDVFLPGLEERGVGDAVAFLGVDGIEGWEQVPKVVVLPDRERKDVVDMHRIR